MSLVFSIRYNKLAKTHHKFSEPTACAPFLRGYLGVMLSFDCPRTTCFTGFLKFCITTHTPVHGNIDLSNTYIYKSEGEPLWMIKLHLSLASNIIAI